MQRILDASQYTTYDKCPALWYTKYILGISGNKVSGEGPLVLGTLFHSGLEHFLTSGTIQIGEDEIKKVSPNQNTIILAENLLHSYVSTYPPTEFHPRSCEDPLLFNVPEIASGWQGISKVDFVFELDRNTEVQINTNETITLSKGIYGLEHKTRQARNRFGYLRSWDSRIQADFETLAIEANFGRCDGILVNVVEYVKPYEPVRTCKECGVKSEVKQWTPVEKSIFACPNCKEHQEISLGKPKTPAKPECYRFLVKRDPDRLSFAEKQIAKMTHMMEECSVSKDPWFNTGSCIDQITYWPCEMYDLHINNKRTDYIQIENPYEYIGYSNENDN